MSEPVVTIREGRIRGKIGTDFDGNNFYSFQGIPYTKPPLGKLRFKAPEPPEKWNGILDATENGNECYVRYNTHSRSEDCLFINVFTKQISSKTLKPVMFWIHGGGFATGSSHSSVYGPEYLVTQDVVLVTFNYRLGVLGIQLMPFIKAYMFALHTPNTWTILGFLSLEDETLEVPGNAGMKDMVMALKWVQNNIKQFSGDPNNVTIFGESAGGVSVHLLMLSSMAKGLFHKAIAESGCALNAWVKGKKHSVHVLAEVLGIESDSEEIILKQLQELSIEELYEATTKLDNRFFIGKVRLLGPVVERYSTKSTFLSEEPIDLIKAGRYHKVPLIMGYCSREGMFVYGLSTISKNSTLLVDETIVPYSMNLRIGSNRYKSVADTIKNFYFNGKDPLENKDDIYRLYTDNYFLLDIYNSARYLSESGTSPIYFYRFSLDTTLNFIKSLYSITGPGACHADELPYLFKNEFTADIERESSEYVGIQRMVKLWTNFAKNGNPTPNIQNELLSTTWEPLQPQKFNYLDIGEELKMKTDLERRAMDFWNNLFRETSTLEAKL